MTKGDVRRRTAVHKAGHAVIAERFGLSVVVIRLLDDGTPSPSWTRTTTRSTKAHVKMALAGFAAVGKLLGDEAEQQNRAAENHDLM